MSLLLDSNILIDFLAGHDPSHRYVTDVEDVAISTITWMEVIVGAANPAEEAVIRSFLAAFDVLAVDTAVAEEAVALRRARRLNLPDAIIFATARVHGRTLVTRNTRDFPAGEAGVFVPYER